jgi:hypothetical protein
MRKSVTLTLLMACFWTIPAAAQIDTQVGDLNRQALDAYQALDIEGARAKLERAIKLAQRSNHVSPQVAQSFLTLGLVYVAGMNDQEQGLASFVNALCMQQDIQLDPLLSTPSVKQVFAQAQKDAKAGACGPATAASPKPVAEPPAEPPPERHKPANVDLTVPDTGSYPAQETEDECPPGMKCGRGGGSDESASSSKFPRFFFSLQFAAGFSLLRSGMEADSDPPPLPAMADMPMVPNVFRYVPDPATQEARYLFDTASPWVPDADSFDDYDPGTTPRGRTPLTANCEADGKPSGPTAMDVTDKNGLPYTTMTPTRYCVRVAKPGFVPGFALRANLGYFVSDAFAVSIPFRFQFNAGEGSFAHILLGLRGELMLSQFTQPTGTAVSWFFGATYGQIQARPEPPDNSSIAGPYVISGPLGLHTGINIRVRLHRNFGLIFSPEIDVLLPELLLHGDLAAGVETAF